MSWKGRAAWSASLAAGMAGVAMTAHWLGLREEDKLEPRPGPQVQRRVLRDSYARAKLDRLDLKQAIGEPSGSDQASSF